MIITFLGHSSLQRCVELSKKIELTIYENTSDNDNIVFYCGGYGDFDNLCVQVCQSIKRKFKKCEIIYITPYITESQQRKMRYLIETCHYDSIIYPPLENVPFKFAISKRNEWMVNEADLIIAYVNHSYGGAYKSLNYARRKKKHIINLAELKY